MTPPEIARRTARTHPALLTIAFLAGGFASLSAQYAPDITPLMRGALLCVSTAITSFWHWAIYTMAQAVTGPAPARWSWLFAAPPVFAFFAGVAEWPTYNSPAAITYLGLYFLSAWCAAQALENADAASRIAPVGRIATSAGLMWVAYIGVWKLWVTIRRVEAAAPAGRDHGMTIRGA